MDIKKQKRPNAEVSLVGTLAAADIERSWDKALAAVTKEVALPGFRKGHVPKERIIQEIGENRIWKEAAERALKGALPVIVKENNVSPIAPVALFWRTDLQKGTDAAFEIIAVVAPTIELGDYRAIAGRVEKSRNAVAEALINAFPADIPLVMVEHEARALMRSAMHKAQKQISDELLLAELRPIAHKRIAFDLILGAIAKKENLKLEDEEDKKKEDDLAHAIVKQGVPHDRAHSFARESLLREKVWVVLGVKPETPAVCST